MGGVQRRERENRGGTLCERDRVCGVEAKRERKRERERESEVCGEAV